MPNSISHKLIKNSQIDYYCKWYKIITFTSNVHNTLSNIMALNKLTKLNRNVRPHENWMQYCNQIYGNQTGKI